jgi:hypothetical protein
MPLSWAPLTVAIGDWNFSRDVALPLGQSSRNFEGAEICDGEEECDKNVNELDQRVQEL